MVLVFIGIALIAMGVLYLRKPIMYRRGIWMKTSIAIRLLSEENYRRYIQGIGILEIAIGVGFIIWALLR